MTNLSLFDIIAIWVIPFILLVMIFLFSSLLLFIFITSSIQSNIRCDLENKVKRKRLLQSGSKVRLSYPYFIGLLLLDNGFQATLLYRVAHYLALHRVRVLAMIIHSFSKFLTNIDISPYADIGPGVMFYHGVGIVIGKKTRIGKYALICQNVTTGGGRPQIGDEVVLWAGAKVIGNVTIGDRSEIGANAVVINDVPADCIAVGVPAKRFLPRPCSNRSNIKEVVR